MKRKYLVNSTLILIIILGCICAEKIDYINLEPRNYVYGIIANGFVFFFGITLAIILIIIDSFKKKSYMSSVILSPFCIVAVFITFCTTQCLPNYIDVAIYHNDKKENNKLVFQYFETGIGGNPHSRVLITDDVSASLRKIQILEEKLVADSLLNLEGSTESRFPKSLIVENKLYLFEKFNDMYK